MGYASLNILLATSANYTFNPNLIIIIIAFLNHINHTSWRGKEEKFCIIGSVKTDQLLCIKETVKSQK